MHREEKRSHTKIYTVSGFTSELKAFLEEKYPFVWIQGEISNLSRPSSGHLYFTLKDPKSQISGIVFRNLGHQLKFNLENGIQITGLARLSVYEPRGTYQLIFEFIEPKGAGALQLAFEQLKSKLAEEGFFDEEHKKKLPSIPDRISVVTSPTGAVIHDIVHIVNRRFPNVIIDVVPVSVQGDKAESEICSALAMLNVRNRSDLIIIARGGGSLEDLAAFNSERVARAVFASDIPVVSSVGHETDYTICDFVADLRAPTPSAAAELVVPVKAELVRRVHALETLLKSRMANVMEIQRKRVETATARLSDPKRKLIDMRLMTEDMTQSLIKSMARTFQRKKDRLTRQTDRLLLVSPLNKLTVQKSILIQLKDRLISSMKTVCYKKSIRSRELSGTLSALNPTAILDRGYSITRTIPGSEIVRDSREVVSGQGLEIILARGSLNVVVKG